MSDSVERKKACLKAAQDAVAGDRQLNYGSPEDNFKRIEVLYNAYFSIRKSPGSPIESWEITILSILLKVARLSNTPSHNDSWIDIAGYAACGADITRSGEK